MYVEELCIPCPEILGQVLRTYLEHHMRELWGNMVSV